MEVIITTSGMAKTGNTGQNNKHINVSGNNHQTFRNIEDSLKQRG